MYINYQDRRQQKDHLPEDNQHGDTDRTTALNISSRP
jgi:hypothetical protein